MVNSFSLFFLSLHSQHPPYLHISFDKCVNTCHGSRIVRGGCNPVFLPLPNLFRKPRPISFRYKSTIGATSTILVVAFSLYLRSAHHPYSENYHRRYLLFFSTHLDNLVPLTRKNSNTYYHVQRPSSQNCNNKNSCYTSHGVCQIVNQVGHLI